MIPGVDLLRLAITRIYNGKHPFRGDRDHFHHNILEKYGYNKTILITFFIIVIPNIVSLILGGTLYLILLSGIIYSVLLFSIKK
jgi:UDP-GlcNAc:undecaprenyl-phosphate GlcNAc-1-phosphate transferase